MAENAGSFVFKRDAVNVGGVDYTVRELSARQRREIFNQYKQDEDSLLMSAMMVQAGCVEFNGKSVDDILDLPGSLFDALSSAVTKVSGIAADDSDDTGEGEKKP